MICNRHVCKEGLCQGWATYGPRAACGPRTILVRPARPQEENNKYGWILCIPWLELWVRSVTNIIMFLWPGVVKRLPRTGLCNFFVITTNTVPIFSFLCMVDEGTYIFIFVHGWQRYLYFHFYAWLTKFTRTNYFNLYVTNPRPNFGSQLISSFAKFCRRSCMIVAKLCVRHFPAQ